MEIKLNASGGNSSVETFSTCSVCVHGPAGCSRRKTISTPGAHPVAVLSYRFWESRFNKDPNLIGKTILVNETAVTVLGVTPPGFFGVNLSNNPDVRVPLMMTPVFNPLPPTRLTSRRHQWLSVMARRKPDVTPEQAQASLNVTYQQIRELEAQEYAASIPNFNRERFMTQRIAMTARRAGSSLLANGAEHVVVVALRRDVRSAADPLREPCEPHDGARDSACFGNSGSSGARCRTIASVAAVVN